MSAYEPYPLLDFHGLYQNKQPFLTPRNAFREMRNMFPFRGQLKSRPGFQFFGGLGTEVTGEVIAAPGVGLDIISFTIANFPVIQPGASWDETIYSAQFTMTQTIAGATTWYDTGQTINPDGGAAVLARVGESGGSGLLNRTNGNVLLVASAGDTFANVPGSCDYDYSDELPVMGIHTFAHPDGTNYLIAANTADIFQFNETLLRFEKIASGAPAFTGGDDDYWWFEAFDGILTMNNGVNPPLKFDPALGTPVQQMATNFDGVPGNDIDSAKMFVRYKGYGIYFAPDEGTGPVLGRARWTQVGNPEAFDLSTDYIDAPTNDIIISAQVVGDRLLVGFRDSWWQLESTGDPTEPFVWIRLNSERGALTRHSAASFSQHVVFRSPVDIEIIDSVGQRPIDDDVPDLTLKFNEDASSYAYAARYDALRQVWWTFSEKNEEKPEHILVMTAEPEGRVSYAVWDVPDVHCLGQTKLTNTLLWDDLWQDWDDYAFSWDSVDIKSGFPIMLLGMRDGTVKKVQSLSGDDGTNISSYAYTGRLNPYPGQRCRLAYVDIHAASLDGAFVTVSALRDYETTPYRFQNADLTPTTAGSEKVKRRVVFNQDAEFHQLRILFYGRAEYSVDAIIPFFKPTGRQREVG